MKIWTALLLATAALWATPLNWEHSYDDAREKAERSQKRVFVMISTEDCSWCKKLEATTLSDPKIVKRLSEEYVSVHVTKDKDRYPETLKAPIVPMCYFLKADGSIIDFARGYWDVTDFNLILNDVVKREKKMEERP